MNKSWLRLVPAVISNRLDGRFHLQSIIANAGWLFIDKILRMGVGLFVTVWVIRYLGPERYGALNFSVAFVALFAVLATLGLDGIVVRDIVHDPSCKNETLATAFVLKLLGSCVSLVLSVVVIFMLRRGESLYWWLVGIAAVAIIFQATDAIDFWYQAEVRSKYTVYARNAAFLTIALLKIGLIIFNAPVIAFACATLGEAVLVSAGLLMIFRLQGNLLRPRLATISRAKGLLIRSWPLFLSSIFGIILMRIDQVMLGQMRGPKEVGIFSAALALSEIWYFIPIAITSSVFPAMVNAWKVDENRFYQRLRELYLIMVFLSFSVAFVLTLLSNQVVIRLYGQEYRESGAVLAIHCWAGVFIFLGLASNMWYLMKNLNHYTLYRCVLGAVVNICLNFALIPEYGAIGAAVSTLLTQAAASYLFDLINRQTRVLFVWKSESILFFIPLTIKYVTKAIRQHG
jgi:PST family polysaccharide transporter